MKRLKAKPSWASEWAPLSPEMFTNGKQERAMEAREKWVRSFEPGLWLVSDGGFFLKLRRPSRASHNWGSIARKILPGSFEFEGHIQSHLFGILGLLEPEKHGW